MAYILAEKLPKGVENVVTGRRAKIGNYLINHPGIDMISLTGDVATGDKMLDAAEKTVKRVRLALDGKARILVFDDGGFPAVVEGLTALSLYNAGQNCGTASRVCARKKVCVKLMAELTLVAASITPADSDDTKNGIPPLISQRQRDRLMSFFIPACYTPISWSPPAARAGSWRLLPPDRPRRRP